MMRSNDSFCRIFIFLQNGLLLRIHGSRCPYPVTARRSVPCGSPLRRTLSAGRVATGGCRTIEALLSLVPQGHRVLSLWHTRVLLLALCHTGPRLFWPCGTCGHHGSGLVCPWAMKFWPGDISGHLSFGLVSLGAICVVARWLLASTSSPASGRGGSGGAASGRAVTLGPCRVIRLWLAW